MYVNNERIMIYVSYSKEGCSYSKEGCVNNFVKRCQKWPCELSFLCSQRYSHARTARKGDDSMASVFKPTFTRYVDPGGKRVSRDTPGARKVREKATKWYGQYTDVDDKLTKHPSALIRLRRVRCSRIWCERPNAARRV